VGKVLGTSALGFFMMASRIAVMPSGEISHVIAQVMFPAYSRLQNDAHRLREAFLKVTKLAAFISFPITGLIIVLAPDFTRIFMGEKWNAIVPAMQVLALVGLMGTIAATFGHMFYAIGKPKIDAAMQAFRLAMLAVLLVPFTLKWNILGTSVAAFLNVFIAVVVFGLISVRITGCGIRRYAMTFLFPLVNTSIAVLLLLGLKTLVKVGAADVVALAFAGLTSYVLLTFILDKYFNLGITPVIRGVLGGVLGGAKPSVSER
jgi:O-antigen/teichoic acid export membrane protein